jgi:1-deoxy-D-xylulose-5-phosphate reductoisomerase
MKKISILGSTGSIGTNTLNVLRDFPDKFQVVGLSAGKNIPMMVKQIAEFKPSVVSVQELPDADFLLKQLRSHNIATDRLDILYGTDGATEVATHPETHLVVAAISGSKGLIPTYNAVNAGKDIALANKETLVMAGHLIMAKAEERGVQILPVDSEHNAIHQCLRGACRSEIRRLILTASGGPFLHTPKEGLERVTPEEALRHPTWQMGRKITVDSATLMNKGLEIIEARWLFGVTVEEIEVLIHPQSTVHSMVEMIDGSVIAQLGVTDMRIAIQYALTYPERWSGHLPSLELEKLRSLEFLAPDYEKFPCLRLAYKSLRMGGTMPIVLNAVNEIAVESFLAQKIRFTEIPQLIEWALDAHPVGTVDSLDTVLDVDRDVRRQVQGVLSIGIKS